MQTSSSPPQTLAPPPAPPSPAPGVSGVTVPGPARPLTAQEVAALRARRSELSSQLQSADSRRNRLVEQLNRTDGAARAGVEQRIMVLDRRILQLESDIAESGRQLTTAPAGVLVSSSTVPTEFGGLSAGNITGISIVFIIFVLAPLALAAARLMWKRAVAPPPPRGLGEATQRLANLEQAVDAIAIEIERVSEGQRFVTRLLSEAPAHAALGAGQAPAEPIRVRDEAAVRVPREST